MEELKLYDYQERFINSKEKLVIGNFARGMGKTFCLAQKIIKEKLEKVLIYSKTHRVGINITEKIKDIANDIDILKSNVLCINNVNNTKTIITWKNNKKTTIFFENDEDVMWQYSADLTIFEDVYCLENYKALNEYIRSRDSHVQIICTTTENNYDKHLQKNYPDADIIEVDSLQGVRKGLFDSEVLMKDFKEYDDHSFYNELAILSNPYINKNTQNKYISANKIDIQGDLNINNNDFLDRTLGDLIKEYESIPVQNNTVMTRQNILNMIMSIKNTKNCGIKFGESFVSLAEKIQKSLYEKDKENLDLLKDAKSKIEDKIKETIDKPSRIMGLDCNFASNSGYDKISICIVDVYDNANRVVHEQELTFNTNKDNSISIIIKGIFDEFNVNKIVIDKCSSGIVLYDNLVNSNVFKNGDIEAIDYCFRGTNYMHEFIMNTYNFGYFLNRFPMLNKQLNNLYVDGDKNGIIIFKTKDKNMDMGLSHAFKNIAIYVFKNKELN